MHLHGNDLLLLLHELAGSARLGGVRAAVRGWAGSARAGGVKSSPDAHAGDKRGAKGSPEKD